MNTVTSQVCLLAMLVAVALASPVYPRHDQSEVYPIVQYENYDTEYGHHFSYNTADGQKRDEELIINNKGTENEEIVISGHYSYVGSDGLVYHVSYTADKNGYHATVDPPHVETIGQYPAALPVAEANIPGPPIAARRPVSYRPARY